MKKCPFCLADILDEALKCKYCGEWVQNKPKENHERATPIWERERFKKYLILASLASLLLIILIGAYLLLFSKHENNIPQGGNIIGNQDKSVNQEEIKIKMILRTAATVEYEIVHLLTSYFIKEPFSTLDKDGYAICIEPSNPKLTCDNVFRMSARDYYTDLDSIVRFFIAGRQERSPFDSTKPLFVNSQGNVGTIVLQAIDDRFIRLQIYGNNVKQPVFNKDISAE